MSRSKPSESAPPAARAITVSVTFFAGLRRLLPDGAGRQRQYTLPAGATLADLLGVIGVDGAADLTAAVDGELASADTALRHGADVMLLHPMEGGAGAAIDEDAARAA